MGILSISTSNHLSVPLPHSVGGAERHVPRCLHFHRLPALDVDVFLPSFCTFPVDAQSHAAASAFDCLLHPEAVVVIVALVQAVLSARLVTPLAFPPIVKAF